MTIAAESIEELDFPTPELAPEPKISAQDIYDAVNALRGGHFPTLIFDEPQCYCSPSRGQFL